MARECPDCHGVVIDKRLGRCGACGARLGNDDRPGRWEDGMVPYLLAAAIIGLIAMALVYLKLLPGQ
jgi:hypothetical protein